MTQKSTKITVTFNIYVIQSFTKFMNQCTDKTLKHTETNKE